MSYSYDSFGSHVICIFSGPCVTDTFVTIRLSSDSGVASCTVENGPVPKLLTAATRNNVSCPFAIVAACLPGSTVYALVVPFKIISSAIILKLFPPFIFPIVTTAFSRGFVFLLTIVCKL